MLSILKQYDTKENTYFNYMFSYVALPNGYSSKNAHQNQVNFISNINFSIGQIKITPKYHNVMLLILNRTTFYAFCG